MRSFSFLWALFLCASARVPISRRDNINGYTGCTDPEQKNAINEAYNDALEMANLIDPFLLVPHDELSQTQLELKRGVLEKRFFGDDDDKRFDDERKPLIRSECRIFLRTYDSMLTVSN
jgi:hypothetical protein